MVNRDAEAEKLLLEVESVIEKLDEMNKNMVMIGWINYLVLMEVPFERVSKEGMPYRKIFFIKNND